MRKASMILGIIGGVIAILVALIAILGGMFFNSVTPQLLNQMTEMQEEMMDEYPAELQEIPDEAELELGTKFASGIFTGLGIVILIAGLLGIIGGAIVKKNNIVAGVLMLIASVIAMFTVWGLFAFIPLLLGGIFALVKDKSQQNMQYYDNQTV